MIHLIIQQFVRKAIHISIQELAVHSRFPQATHKKHIENIEKDLS